MFKEYGRVRVRDTGMYGTIVDWKQGNPGCEVELDGWQHDGQIDGDRQFPYSFAITDLEELVEVSDSQRKALFDEFDILMLSSFCWINSPRAPIVVIKRNDDGLEVSVQNWTYELNETRMVEDGEAAKLLSAVFAMHADTWVDPFTPDFKVLDGYSWSLDVYAGNRYFSCSGENVVPNELVDLFYAVADIGLPLAWNGSELLLPQESEVD